jgi:hypothetical protein
LLSVVVTLALWVVIYQILSRLIFFNRLREWKVMEDMVNEGAQTGCLMLVSGIGAIVAGIVVVAAAGW